MRAVHAFLNFLLRLLSSSKLALLLVLLIILLSLAGTLLPQESKFKPEELTQWQTEHPAVTFILRPLGLFHVFYSIPFLAAIFLLGVNTLTCTLLRFFREGGISTLKGQEAFQNTGFIAIHFSLIMLFAGGFWSAARRLDGFILLTEGQSFIEEHKGYLRISEGLLHQEHHKGFLVRLKRVSIEYKKNRYPIDITSHLEIWMNENKLAEDTAKVNKPFAYQGLTFTQDQTGFSPRLMIRHKESGRLLVNSFIALKTFQDGENMKYQDFLPLPFFKQRVVVSLYPSYTQFDGWVEKTGEKPENPLLLIEMEDGSGQVVSRGHAALGEKIEMNEYTFGFEDLRRWTSLRVVRDPGYPIVVIALWLGVAALILRYIPDLWKWFRIERYSQKKD